MGWRNAGGLLLALALGCATQAPSEQAWVEVRTPHFEILSSLSRTATAELARDLELFRRAVELLAAEGLPAAERPARVLAFDDRRFGRSFAVADRSSYLLASLDGPVLVLRGAGGFRGDADAELRHQLAHTLLRARDELGAPLWYDEGVARVASAIEVGDELARIGAVTGERLDALRDGPRIPVRELLQTPAFDDPDGPRRRRFEAQSFALVHYLCFGPRAPRHAPARLLELRGAEPADAAWLERLLGLSEVELDRELAEHPSRAQVGSLELRAGNEAGAPPRARPMARSEVLVLLGELALALGRGDLARDHFERARGSTQQAARVRAGLAAVLALDGDPTQATILLDEALARAPRDPRIQRRAGDLWLWRARLATDPDERERHAERARLHYGRSLDRDPHQAGAHAGIAASWGVVGRDLEAALASVAKALRLNPGSTPLWTLRAQLLSASGDARAAADLARALRARPHGGLEPGTPVPLSIGRTSVGAR